MDYVTLITWKREKRRELYQSTISVCYLIQASVNLNLILISYMYTVNPEPIAFKTENTNNY